MKLLYILLSALAPAACLASAIGEKDEPSPWEGVDPGPSQIRNMTVTVDFGRNLKIYQYAYDIYFRFHGTQDIVQAGAHVSPSSGKQFHGFFISFMNKTTTVDRNCRVGTDKYKEEGVSCKVTMKGWKREIYKIQVAKLTGSTWEGVLINTVTGDITTMGTFDLPPEAGNIKGYYRFETWSH